VNQPQRKPTRKVASPDSTRLLDALSQGVLLLDAEDRVLYLNPAAEDLLGAGGLDVVGRSLTELIPETPLAELVSRARSGFEILSQRDLIFTTQSGRHQVDCVTSPDADGAVLIELRDRDRVSRIRGEHRLQEAREASRGLARRLAHEVKNPLGGMRGAAQLLARRLSDPDHHRFTDLIIEETDRLSALVDALLGPRQPPALEPTNVHQVLQRVIDLISAESGPELNIKRDYDPSLPDLDADPALLTQVFLNLVANAMQAVDGVGTVRLSTRSLRHFTIGETVHRLCAAVTITDDGPGVPENIADNIFLPLVSGSDRGTGLGLSVAQELVYRHGGLIEFQSEPGCTEFTVVLPYEERARHTPHEARQAEGREREAPSPRSQAPSQNGGGKR
jgi:two-component system, NtrC family, nitrogen regulation sensor histidine kinase GlnL